MLTQFKIKDLNNNEKPRERLIYKGPSALSNAELLAIVLRSGGKESSALDIANQLLNKFGGLKELINVNIEQLQEFKNIGLAKATSIKAILEIALRINAGEDIKTYIKKPEDIFRILKKDLFEKAKEHLYLISLDTRNRLISVDLISIGTVNETLVHPREVFKQALARNAVSIIIVHNHPSGISEPSKDDLLVTECIAKTGTSLGIPLLDHIIISNNAFTSLKSLNLFTKGGDISEETDI